jgi:hypothetical protein
MPGALNRPVRQNVAKCHLEILMSAVIGHGAHPALTLDETDPLSVRPHHAKHSLIGNIARRRHIFEVVHVRH